MVSHFLIKQYIYIYIHKICALPQVLTLTTIDHKARWSHIHMHKISISWMTGMLRSHACKSSKPLSFSSIPSREFSCTQLITRGLLSCSQTHLHVMLIYTSFHHMHARIHLMHVSLSFHISHFVMHQSQFIQSFSFTYASHSYMHGSSYNQSSHRITLYSSMHNPIVSH